MEVKNNNNKDTNNKDEDNDNHIEFAANGSTVVSETILIAIKSLKSCEALDGCYKDSC